MLFELSTKTLVELDGGRLAAAMDEELQHVMMDLQNRPAMTTARKVVLVLDVKPVCDEQGELFQADVQFSVNHSIPKRKTQVYPMKYRQRAGKPQLVFNELSLDNPDQAGLPFGGDE